MHRTRIKFCGLTREEDAQAAAQLGVDAVGMVFYPPARRNVSIEQAARIMNALPPFVTPVALTVNADANAILELAGRLRIRHVQLHGDEPPELVRKLTDLAVLKAVRVDANLLATLAGWRQAIERLELRNFQGVVLESHRPRGTATSGDGAPGGTGVENDWDVIVSAIKQDAFAGLGTIVAAGGLTALNVGEVIGKLHPFAVDVSSGIESTPGCKSPDKMKAFVTAVRQAQTVDADGVNPIF